MPHQQSRFSRISSNFSSEVRKTISQILSLPSEFDSDWDILDEIHEGDTHLVLVHYNSSSLERKEEENEFQTKILSLRGQVIDLNKKKVILPANGHIPSYQVSSSIVFDSSLEKYVVPLLSNDGISSKQNLYLDSNCSFYRGFETTHVRTFLYPVNGKEEYFFTTRSKIRGFNSRWGNSKTFYEFFLSQVDEEKLKEILSQIDYASFLLLSPSISLCSQSSKVGIFQTDDSPSISHLDLPVYTSEPIEDLNNWIFPSTNNSLSDPRFHSGEFIAVKKPDGRILRLNSPSYYYKSIVIGNEHNLYYRFFLLARRILEGGYPEIEIFLGFTPPLLPEYEIEQLLKEKEIAVLYWGELFSLSAGFQRKEETKDYVSRFYKDIESIANFILHKYTKVKNDLDTVVVALTSKRPLVSDVSKNQFQRLFNLVQTGTDEEKKRRLLLHLKRSESPESLYKLSTVIRTIQNAFDKKKEE